MNSHCELCGSSQKHILFQGRDWLHGLPVQGQVLQCGQCGLIYLWPRPLRPLDSYPEDYGPHMGRQESADIGYSAGHRGSVLRKARLANQYKPGVLLDMGCADGEFLAAVSSLGDRPVLGMDLNGNAVRRARQHFGLDVWVGNVPGLPLPDESVRVATLWHVLEHLPDPVAALRDIGRTLAPDGVLVVACPMADSWEAKLFGRYWSGYDVPRHLFSFSRQTLPRLLRDVGFDAHEALHIVQGYNSAKISSSFWLQRIPFFRREPGLLRQAAAPMGAAFAVASELLSRVFGNRRSIAVYLAHKRLPASQGSDQASVS